MFPTSYSDIIGLMDQIDPVQYAATRNYIHGAVTRMSPYISRGVMSTQQMLRRMLERGYTVHQMNCLIRELAWRDYFQQVWMARGNDINSDLRYTQAPVNNEAIPRNIVAHCTGIEAIDKAVADLYNTGYMHNHVRMYVASLCCNVAHSHWTFPARWMYYHLLDADWASNALSWQWVAGSFSQKKYYANQENINKYCNTRQQGTFLDLPYGLIENAEIPDQLAVIDLPVLQTVLPDAPYPLIDKSLPVCVYNFYNLDCNWLKDIQANRILLLEPDFFKQYPVSAKTIRFLLSLSENIPGVQIFTAAFETLFESIPGGQIHYKEHPANRHYRGIAHSREWLFEEVTGYFPSFSAYWKQCQKHLKKYSTFTQ